MALLEVKQVSKHYSGHTALSEVSLSIEQGRIFGLLGPNGAGKTTLIRIINCITAPDSGEVLFAGERLSPKHIERIGYLPEERGLYRKMKVGEQSIYLARLKGLSKAEAERRLTQWFEKLDIMPWWNKRIEELSKGMAQKVQFVCTVLHEPELLIFDEPFSGFDPVNANLLRDEILELKRKGHTIIFSTHNMQSVEELCDDIALINKSQLVLGGEVNEVRMRYAMPRLSLKLNGLISLEALAPLGATDLIHSQGQTTLSLPMPEGGIPAFVRSLPEGLDLISLSREIPSMQEIFLQTVEANNTTNYAE